MGKKPQRSTWPEAKKLCRLNQDDIEMAQRLGFGPDTLIRMRPGSTQRWKSPVKNWIRELYCRRFGIVLGEAPKPPAPTEPIVYDEEAACLYGEQMYWEDYRHRNPKPASPKSPAAYKPDQLPIYTNVTDDDVPF